MDVLKPSPIPESGEAVRGKSQAAHMNITKYGDIKTFWNKKYFSDEVKQQFDMF